MIFNIPNSLSFFRIALIPCLILVFYLPDEILSISQKNLTATLIFLLAAITDWLDGLFCKPCKVAYSDVTLRRNQTVRSMQVVLEIFTAS